MARLTFRADEEVVSQIKEMDSSQSEVMREALREYLSLNSETELDHSAERLFDKKTSDTNGLYIRNQYQGGSHWRRPTNF